MPTFATPQPIAATIELVVGDARITASDRDDTVVQVRPSDDSHEPDVRAAQQTRVEYSAGSLLVKAAKQRGLGPFGKPGSIDVTIDLPTGSALEADASIGAFHSIGRLGACRVKTALGDVHLGATAALDVNTAVGAIVVDQVAGDAEVRTGSGTVRVGAIEGSAVFKNSNGDSRIGQISGDLRVNAANGDIIVDHAHRDVSAATANGDVRIGELACGSASLKTGFGQIEVGIRAGTAARLDAHTSFGRVDNHLDVADSPEPSDRTLDLRAHTSYGDIVIRRSPTPQ